jgi:hypothetical protein
VAVGDSVLVSGSVRDFYPLSSGDSVATTSNLSVTEIGTPTVIVRSHGIPLPAPEVIGPGTLPDAYAPNLNGANIESTPITQYQVVHVNAEYADQTSDHDPQVVRLRP